MSKMLKELTEVEKQQYEKLKGTLRIQSSKRQRNVHQSVSSETFNSFKSTSKTTTNFVALTEQKHIKPVEYSTKRKLANKRNLSVWKVRENIYSTKGSHKTTSKKSKINQHSKCSYFLTKNSVKKNPKRIERLSPAGFIKYQTNSTRAHNRSCTVSN